MNARWSAPAAGLAALALLSAPARAEDVARVGLPGSIGSLVAGADGGAWVAIERADGWAVGRANADGRFRSTALKALIGEGTLGPDGAAYFSSGGKRLARVDAAGAVTFSGAVSRRADDFLGFSLATGPDGRLWTTTLLDGRLVRITPAGQATFTRLKLPGCKTPFLGTTMARASDGTVWIGDALCERLIHLSADGAPTVVKVGSHLPLTLTGDAAGGVWFADGAGLGGHADAAGHVGYFSHGNDRGRGVAVAPDGAAWFALARCALARAAPDGTVTEQPAPVPAVALAFDPAGGLWLASRTRLAHSTVAALGAGTCDDTPPRIDVTTARRVGIAALRRGLRVAVREPAYVRTAVALDYGSDGDLLGPHDRLFAHAGSLRVRFGAKELRQLARAKRPTLTLLATAEDRDGNQAVKRVTLRVTR